MKIISFILCILISCVAFAQNSQNDEPIVQGSLHVYGDIYKYKGPIKGRVGLETTAAITVYVRTDGNDNNTCTVDSAAGACLTIQAAIDKIPKAIKHAVAINLGAGNFAGFAIEHFSFIGKDATMVVTGTLGNPTPATGTVSGTASSGSTSQCVDAGQSWTENDFRGKLVKVGSQYRVVLNNDATTLNLVGELAATCSGQTYELFEQKTVVTSATPLATDYTTGIMISGIKNSFMQLPYPKLLNIKVTAGVIFAIRIQTGSGAWLERLAMVGQAVGFQIQQIGQSRLDILDCFSGSQTYYGFYFQEAGFSSRDQNGQGISRLYAYSSGLYGFTLYSMPYGQEFHDIFAYNSGLHGVYAYQIDNIQFSHVVSKYNTGSGMSLHDSFNIDGDDDLMDLSNNGAYGLEVGFFEYNNSSMTLGYNSIISNNTAGGIYVIYASAIYCTGAVTGTGNGGYGVRLEDMSSMTINSGVTVTGSSGDATINSGSVVLTWATDFATNGDAIINTANQCKIKRTDP